jgi:hypothetical protein
VLESKQETFAKIVEELKAKQVYFETVAARLESLELHQNRSIQLTAEKSFGDQ